MNDFAGAGLWARDAAGLVPVDLLAPTRREILLSLRVEGEASIDDLAARLHLTSSALRPHLAILEAEGYITLRETGKGPGRRRRLHAISPAGESLFPGLGEETALLVARMALAGSPNDAFAAIFSFLKDSSPSLGDRWPVVTGALARRGFLPRVTGDEVDLRHCPLRNLALHQPVVCQAEQRALHCATGQRVERVAHRLEGDESCVYRVLPPGGESGK
ncbi:MAG: ArsR family transcriptional regulator [Dehalococcoidia bacterium]|nr:ArsR family transcriptional regulator [Dehalococcoidia bacterium]